LGWRGDARSGSEGADGLRFGIRTHVRPQSFSLRHVAVGASTTDALIGKPIPFNDLAILFTDWQLD